MIADARQICGLILKETILNFVQFAAYKIRFSLHLICAIKQITNEQIVLKVK